MTLGGDVPGEVPGGRRRPRALKTPQGLSTIHLHVRLSEPSYYFLERESKRRGMSMARTLDDILMIYKLRLRPPKKSGTTD